MLGDDGVGKAGCALRLRGRKEHLALGRLATKREDKASGQACLVPESGLCPSMVPPPGKPPWAAGPVRKSSGWLR